MTARWAPFTNMKTLADEPGFVVDHADGVYVWDEEGRRYLDGHAGLWLVNVGYGQESIIRAMQEQTAQLAWFPSFGGTANRPSLELSERLVDILEPDGMASVFFSNDGSEAVETALKMARLYWIAKGQPRKVKFLGRQYGYHGVTFGALSVAGITSNRSLFEPLLPSVAHGPAPYVSHCPYHGPDSPCSWACVAEMERIIQFEDPSTIAALIAEPVQAAGGVIIPPPGYVEKLRELCRRYGILFIADEVVTAFGRLGTWTGSRYYGIQPDLMTFAKGLTSGYMPLGATAVSADVVNTILTLPGEGPEFRHGNTYSGHPVACAAALANLQLLEDGALFDNATAMGRHLGQRLEGLVAKYPQRLRYPGSIGLLGRVEVIARNTEPAGHTALVIAAEMRKRGVIIRVAGDILTFSPPLIIQEGEIDALTGALDGVLQDLPPGEA